MHALLGAFASVLFFVAVAAGADDKPAHPSQTRRTAECTAHAGDKHLTGDARKQFISECVKKGATMREDTSATEKDSHSGAPSDSEHHATQGERMKACNHEASTKNLHGDERKSFMSHCLKAEKKS